MTTIPYRSGSTRMVPKILLTITVTGEVVCIGGPEGRRLCQLLVLEFGENSGSVFLGLVLSVLGMGHADKMKWHNPYLSRKTRGECAKLFISK